jgi:hypothetical protein
MVGSGLPLRFSLSLSLTQTLPDPTFSLLYPLSITGLHRRLSNMAPAASNPTEAQELCTMCHRAGTMRCGGCKELHYCSKMCQKNDWPIHKLICKTLKDFSPENRPGSDYKRAILFPQDGEQPHFFWLRYITPSDDDYPQDFGKGHDVPATSSILNAKIEEYGGVIIPTVRSIVLSKPLDNRFTIMGKVRRVDTSAAMPNNVC